jgi:hypothetical protein
MLGLIAYLLCAGLFLGSGYLGLNFLAGNFDEPARTMVTRGDTGQKIRTKHNGNKPPSPIVNSEATPASRDVAFGQTTQPENGGKDAVPESETVWSAPQPNQPASPASNAQWMTINPAVADPTPTDQSVSNALNAVRKGDSEEGQHPDSSTSAPAQTADTLQQAAIAPHAKTTQTVRNAGLDLRVMAAASKPPRAKQKGPSTSRSSKSTKPALVMMVLQTIEYPDGRREQRLVTRRQAQLDR